MPSALALAGDGANWVLMTPTAQWAPRDWHAAAGTDYAPLGGSVLIPAGDTEADITVAPLGDDAIEGDETVVLTLLPDAAYTLGYRTNAVVTIRDSAYAQWGIDQFTPAQQGDPSVSGPDADPDGDDLPNFMEYVMGKDPLTADIPPFGFRPGATNVDFTVTLSRDAVEGNLAIDATGNLLREPFEAITPQLMQVVQEENRNRLTLRQTYPPGEGGARTGRFYRLRAGR